MLTHRLLYLGLVGSLMSATERCVIQPKRYSSPMLSGGDMQSLVGVMMSGGCLDRSFSIPGWEDA